jgi:methylmalonyl-CoA/ethylmalonyl-CoA epimerase
MSRVTGFAHVGVIVPELGPVAELFGRRLGLRVRGPEPEPELGLEVLWVTAGDTTLEFVAPTRDDSRAAAVLARGDGGVHHVALRVEGLDELLDELDGAGVALRDRNPRSGAHGSRVAFLDPDGPGGAGALVELVEGGH